MSEPTQATAAPPAPPKIDERLLQYAEVGDIVLYYHGGNKDPQGAKAIGVVTLRGHGSARDLNMIAADTADTTPLGGVRCHHDKTAKAPEIEELGTWEPRPIDIAMRSMLLSLGVVAWGPESGLLVPPEEAKAEAARLEAARAERAAKARRFVDSQKKPAVA